MRLPAILCKNIPVLRFSCSFKSFIFRHYFPFLWNLLFFLIQHPYAIASSGAVSVSNETNEMPLGARSGQIIEKEELRGHSRRPVSCCDIGNSGFPRPQLQSGRKIDWKKLEESSVLYTFHAGHRSDLFSGIRQSECIVYYAFFQWYHRYLAAQSKTSTKSYLTLSPLFSKS